MVAVARSCEASPVRALKNAWGVRLLVKVSTLARISSVFKPACFLLPPAIWSCVANPIADPAESAESRANTTVEHDAGDLLTVWSA